MLSDEKGTVNGTVRNTRRKRKKTLCHCSALSRLLLALHGDWLVGWSRDGRGIENPTLLVSLRLEAW
jgi:hypothetical protein